MRTRFVVKNPHKGSLIVKNPLLRKWIRIQISLLCVTEYTWAVRDFEYIDETCKRLKTYLSYDGTC